MNLDLYASPNRIEQREPIENNAHLASVSVSIPTILGRYMAYGDPFKLRNGGEIIEDKSETFQRQKDIDLFLDYLSLSRKFVESCRDVSCCIKSKEGIKLKYFFTKEYAVEAPKAYQTIALLEKDSDTWNISKIEAIINDLSKLLTNVKNKKIKEPEKLEPYFHLFNAFSKAVLKNPRPACHGFCNCERDCDD